MEGCFIGHVHFEQLSQGKGTHETFDYTPFSDRELLTELIRNRMSLDDSFAEKVYPSGALSSCGGIIFNECILDTYIALDELIASTKLSKKQLAVLNLVMRGYTIQDIEDDCGISHQCASGLFKRALDALVNQNYVRWKSVVARAGEDD